MGNLPPLRLGQGPEQTLILAPLEGITTSVYRAVIARRYGGLDGAISPFIGTIRGTKRYTYHLRDVLPEKNSLFPLVPQVLGADVEGIIEVASACARLGYPQINWNIGCPIPSIVRKRRGSGILPHPDMVEAVLEKVCRPEMPAFSIKLRLGLTEGDEWRRLVPLFNDFDLDFLVLHPRTGAQMYRGLPDTQAYGEFLASSRTPVMYSGDIRSIEDARLHRRRFPRSAALLLGRGILSRPMLAAEIKGETRIPFDHHELIGFLRELALAYAAEGSSGRRAAGKVKLHFGYLRQGTDDPEAAEELRKTLLPCAGYADLEAVLH